MNMGVMDKFLNAMKLGDVEDEYDSDDYYDEDEIEETPKKSFFKEKSHEEEDEEFEHRKSSSKVTPIRQVKRTPGSNMEVCIIKPTSMEDAQEITDTLVANRTVVLNLEGLDVEIILTSGADAVAASVISGDSEIGFCGSEQSIYIYNGGR